MVELLKSTIRCKMWFWSFTYSTAALQAHHDFAVLPNGNVLLTAWEVKSIAELSAVGYTSTREKWPTHIIEVQRDGTGGKNCLGMAFMGSHDSG